MVYEQPEARAVCQCINAAEDVGKSIQSQHCSQTAFRITPPASQLAQVQPPHPALVAARVHLDVPKVK